MTVASTMQVNLPRLGVSTGVEARCMAEFSFYRVAVAGHCTFQNVYGKTALKGTAPYLNSHSLLATALNNWLNKASPSSPRGSVDAMKCNCECGGSVDCKRHCMYLGAHTWSFERVVPWFDFDIVQQPFLGYLGV